MAFPHPTEQIIRREGTGTIGKEGADGSGHLPALRASIWQGSGSGTLHAPRYPRAQNSSKFFQEAPGFTSWAAAPSESSPKPLSAGAGAARGAHGGPACRALHLEAIPKDHCLLASRHRWGMRPPPQSPQLLRSPEPCRACSSPTAAPGKQSWEQAHGTPVRLPTVGHPSPGISSPSYKLQGGDTRGKGKDPFSFFVSFFFFFTPKSLG